MRVFFRGPRIFGVRPGISFGPEDFKPRTARVSRGRSSVEPITGSFVYIINDGHKVGSSIDPNRRLRELQTGNPRPLQFSFVGITPGPGFDIELKAKDMLATYRANIRGGDEWFDTSPEIATAAMMGAAGTIGQKLNAISPSQIAPILQIARAGGLRPEQGPMRRNLPLLIIEAIAMMAFAIFGSHITGEPELFVPIAAGTYLLFFLLTKRCSAKTSDQWCLSFSRASRFM